MNPAILNYMQNQQAQQNTAPEGQSFNPFNSGIKAAIESARVSLDMTEKQQDKALRRSMLTFGNAYANEPRQKGFLANFGSVSRSLSPAIMAHDESEDMAFKENNDLANQILKYQAAEQERQAQDEERQWQRSHAENQLAEQQRYHDMMSEYKNKKLEQNETPLSSELSEMELFPIDNKKDFTAYLKDKKSLGTILNEVKDLEKDYTTFRTAAAKNIFDPMAPSGKFTRPAKNLAGRFFNNKSLKNETAERETLNSKLNKFVISSERALKGGGVMGPRLIELFKEQGIYPSLDTDTPEIFKSKLKMLKEEIENSYKAANLSLQHRVHIDPSQVNDFESKLSAKQSIVNKPANNDFENKSSAKQSIVNEPANNDTVLMQDREGKNYQIPATEVNEAVQDGLILIEG
jgi:hypothetical protein